MASGLGDEYLFHGHTNEASVSQTLPRSEDLYKVQGKKRLTCTWTTTYEGGSCSKGADLDS